MDTELLDLREIGAMAQVGSRTCPIFQRNQQEVDSEGKPEISNPSESEEDDGDREVDECRGLSDEADAIRNGTEGNRAQPFDSGPDPGLLSFLRRYLTGPMESDVAGPPGGP
jgi:hypothetical protein